MKQVTFFLSLRLFISYLDISGVGRSFICICLYIQWQFFKVTSPPESEQQTHYCMPMKHEYSSPLLCPVSNTCPYKCPVSTCPCPYCVQCRCFIAACAHFAALFKWQTFDHSIQKSTCKKIPCPCCISCLCFSYCRDTCNLSRLKQT